MDLKGQIPEGTQDLLPIVAEEKRIIEETILHLFKDWGYQELLTPTLEYLDSLAIGTGEGLQSKMYRLFDRKGRILALRPEMTTPIARLVATKLKNLIPARLCYLANLFRYEDLQKGKYREFYQAGLEYIGEKSPAADAEVLALAVKALQRVGLEHFTIHIGHMLFFQGLTATYRVDNKRATIFREALINRDFVTFKQEIERSSLKDHEKENLLLLPILQKKGKIPEKAYGLATHPLSIKAIENLEEILKYLHRLDIQDHCYIDLGIFRDLDYYSGMVFEGFSPGVGFNICGGGRYDHLLGEFGLHRPACGFALGIDRILIARKKEEVQPEEREKSSLIIFQESREEEAYQFFLSVQERGERCELEMKRRPVEESIEYAKKKGIYQILYIGDTPPQTRGVPFKSLQDSDIYSMELLYKGGERC